MRHPGPGDKPAEPPRAPVWVSYVLAVVSLISIGFFGWLPSLWVAWIRRSDRRLRRRALGQSAALLVVLVVGLQVNGSAPVDEAGSPTGAASAVGISLVLLSGLVGAVLAIVQRHPADAVR